MSDGAAPKGSTVVIRPMQAEDLSQVLAIDQASFALPWPESAYRYELFDNPGSLLWVAEVTTPDGERQVIGMVVVWLILDEAHIATIAVHPQYRGQGVATKLLSTALIASIQREMRSATLEVRLHNLAAQRLYRRFGFEVAGSRPRYYRDNNEDALIMTVSPLNQAYREWLEREGWKNQDEQPF